MANSRKKENTKKNKLRCEFVPCAKLSMLYINKEWPIEILNHKTS